MNNLNLKPIKPSSFDPVFRGAVARMCVLAELRGICNMAAVPSRVIEDMHDDLVLLKGNEFYETEQCTNLTFCQQICDLMMNGCDLDHENATKSDRIQMIDKLVESLEKMRGAT